MGFGLCCLRCCSYKDNTPNPTPESVDLTHTGPLAFPELDVKEVRAALEDVKSEKGSHIAKLEGLARSLAGACRGMKSVPSGVGAVLLAASKVLEQVYYMVQVPRLVLALVLELAKLLEVVHDNKDKDAAWEEAAGPIHLATLQNAIDTAGDALIRVKQRSKLCGFFKAHSDNKALQDSIRNLKEERKQFCESILTRLACSAHHVVAKQAVAPQLLQQPTQQAGIAGGLSLKGLKGDEPLPPIIFCEKIAYATPEDFGCGVASDNFRRLVEFTEKQHESVNSFNCMAQDKHTKEKCTRAAGASYLIVSDKHFESGNSPEAPTAKELRPLGCPCVVHVCTYSHGKDRSWHAIYMGKAVMKLPLKAEDKAVLESLCARWAQQAP